MPFIPSLATCRCLFRLMRRCFQGRWICLPVSERFRLLWKCHSLTEHKSFVCIQFWMSNISISLIDRTLSGATTSKQSGAGNDGNKGVLQSQPTGGCGDVRLFDLVSLFNHIYPTSPLRQDMAQGQFLSGVWIQSFPSPRLVASPRLKNPVCLTIYP